MRNWMKRLLTLALALCMAAALLTACGKKETPAEDFLYERNNGEITITGYTGAEREIVIPKEIDGRPVTAIGERAFAHYDLTSVTFPNTLTYIGEYAFDDCETLTEVNLPDSLTYLGWYSFGGCDSLTELLLPKNTALPAEDFWERISSPCSPTTTVIIVKDSVAYAQLQDKDYIIDDKLNYKVR